MFRALVHHAIDCAVVSGVDPGVAVSVVDFDEIIWILNVGVITATGTLDAKIQESVDLAFTSPVDISGAAWAQFLPAGDQVTTYGRIDNSEGVRLPFQRILLTQATADALASADALLMKHGQGGPAIYTGLTWNVNS